MTSKEGESRSKKNGFDIGYAYSTNQESDGLA